MPRNRGGGARTPVLLATSPGMPGGTKAQYIDRYIFTYSSMCLFIYIIYSFCICIIQNAVVVEKCQNLYLHVLIYTELYTESHRKLQTSVHNLTLTPKHRIAFDISAFLNKMYFSKIGRFEKS